MTVQRYYDGHWGLVVGDARVYLKELMFQGVTVDLVFADPPFNIGQDYADYNDRIPEAEYEAFTAEWVGAAVNVLRPGGWLVVHCADHMIESLFRAANAVGLRRSGWNIWFYRFGQAGRADRRRRYVNAHMHVVPFYVPPAKMTTFNPDLVDSLRASVYKDPRTLKTTTPGKRPALDVWGVDDGECWGRIQGTNAERVNGAPNQLPEHLVARVVRTYSNCGDIVVDPFVGSGTTPTVAVALGRAFFGCEISEEIARKAADRIRRGPIREL